MPGTIFSRQTMKNRDWKEARGHVQGNIQFDQAMFESKLDAMVREKVERIVNAMPDASDGRDRQRREIRAFRRTEGVPGRLLRAEPDRQGRQARAQGAEIEGALFESAVIERCRRREESVEEALIDMYLAGVSTRQVDDTGQLLWGDRMPSPDIERQAQARVRRDRRMAHGAVGGRVPIRVRGRRVAQALLGRKRGERRHPGRHRRQQGWSPRGRRVAEGMGEDSASWERFFRGMIERGLKASGSWSATGARDWSPRWTRCCRRRGTSGAWCTSCATCSPRCRPATANGRRRP